MTAELTGEALQFEEQRVATLELRADWQQQLAYVKKECGFRYIRMHGLLTDDMAVYSEDKKGNAIYSYQYIDTLYD